MSSVPYPPYRDDSLPSESHTRYDLSSDEYASPTRPGVTPDSDLRGIGGLLTDLRDGSVKLMRQELALARTEIREEIRTASKSAATAGTGGALTLCGLVVVLMGLGTLLTVGLMAAGASATWAVWAGPLIVGGLAAIIGGAMLAGGLRTLKKQNLVPRDTVRTLKENKRWLEQKV